ncbi:MULTISPECIES: RES family NAD+ phosphorylase [Xanthomonas]|uniref:RES domain-containing protein n=1 Tax=Xanthomonas campestris pv. malvacearum TaxID=86040 RepID=A0AA44YXQ6_XANCM|nr:MULTISPECIES: RES family NAD+ phosphorylase [Xanthomonas]ASY82714.1 RES domain-containing protein [Xanthomonas citri pv. malvacearum]MBV6799877.1 RES family NAD+ phosphorylase [Xanthomonas campestris pv. obscurae]MBV6862176.1 RES family NAD+ phosphorylase [Xanthomonas campestris pv. blepharidis]MCC4629738.1 RES family NAD+ phosphorylase [Xanthomonas citri]NMI15764.1 RES domain-containing protein [Xanthomonas citri]
MSEYWRISAHEGHKGIGGLHVSGRWHNVGKHIIYSAEHPALALVETMAHLDLSLDDVPTNLLLFKISVDTTLPIFKPNLPNGWQANQSMTRKLGDAWLKGGKEPLMAVPSAILPHTTNLIINPQHLAISSGGLVEISKEPIWIDPRFLR